MEYRLAISLMIIIYGLNFVQGLHDPREDDHNGVLGDHNGGLDTPDYDMEDPFDYFGDKKEREKDKTDEKQKDAVMDDSMNFFGDQENKRKPHDNMSNKEMVRIRP